MTLFEFSNVTTQDFVLECEGETIGSWYALDDELSEKYFYCMVDDVYFDRNKIYVSVKPQQQKQCTIRYNEDGDSFEFCTRLSPKDDWDVSLTFQCTQTDSEFIHYSIINELNIAIMRGYNYVGMGYIL